MLSIAAIEDLLLHFPPSVGSSEIPDHAVLFFHFSQSRPDESCSDQAFRALLAQLLHQCQHDRRLLDAASILMCTRRSDQLIAAESEVEELLSLAIRTIPVPILVIDGLDECSDLQAFLRGLHLLYNVSNCKILVFSRPSTVLPRTFKDQSVRHRLGRDENNRAIELYVRPYLNDMIESHLFPRSASVDDLVPKIASRANSLFLWAKLMVNYLQCVALTPRDRAYAIENLNSFEGLDKMFGKILSFIWSQSSVQREAAFKVFQLLIACYRPLIAKEMHVALAVRLGETTCNELDYITDFEVSLIQICGSLVEISCDDKIEFIHSSIREYLTREQHDMNVGKPGGRFVEIVDAHGLAANICLSYLVHDVPPSPLAGSGQVTPDRRAVEKRFPLLKYASEYWSKHAALLMQSFKISNRRKGRPKPFRVFDSALHSFINCPGTICVWIEACWLLGRPPQISGLATAAEALTRALDSGSRRLVLPKDTLKQGQRVSELSSDLKSLDQDWAHVLKSEPNEIWGASIRLFGTSKFLGRDDSSRVLFRNSCNHSVKESSEDGEMLLITRCHQDKALVASLTLVPSP